MSEYNVLYRIGGFLSKFFSAPAPEELQRREEEKKAKALEKEERRKKEALEAKRRSMTTEEYMDTIGEPGDMVVRLNTHDLFDAVNFYVKFRFPGYRIVGTSMRQDQHAENLSVEAFIKLHPVSSPPAAVDQKPKA